MSSCRDRRAEARPRARRSGLRQTFAALLSIARSVLEVSNPDLFTAAQIPQPNRRVPASGNENRSTVSIRDLQ